MSLQNYLTNFSRLRQGKDHRYMRVNYYEWLLRHGREFAYTPNESLPWGTLKECYANSARLAMSHPDRYVYCEGMAVSNVAGLPLSHAWVYDLQTMQMIDLTWRDGGREYFGVPFQTEFVKQVLLDTRVYGEIVGRAMRKHSAPELFLHPLTNNQINKRP